MFNSFWKFFKKNHNNIIQFFQGFLFVFVSIILLLVIFSDVILSSVGEVNEYIKWINISVVFIGVIVLLLLFISYLSPNDKDEDSFVISGQSILDIIDEHSNNLTEEEKLQEYTEHKTQWITSRIRSAIEQQEKKSIINLFLGIFFSLTGAGALLYLSYYFNFSPKDNLDFLSNFLPRLSLILLIETFAYFFLRLYKDNLKEIKYWHNELTAIEHRILALNLALKRNNDELCQDILRSFSQFEKNYRYTDEKNDFHFSADYLAKIIKSIKQ